MNLNKIDIEIIKIIVSEPSIEQLKYLVASNTLNSSEEKLIDSLLDNASSIGRYAVKNKLLSIGMDPDFLSSIEVINKKDLNVYIEKLIITKRKIENQNLIESSLNTSCYEQFEKECLDVLRKRYVNAIDAEDDGIFESLRYLERDEIDTCCDTSTAVEYIDLLIGGVPSGTVTSVVGTSEYHKSILALNIAYDSISKGRNVLYFSLGFSKRVMYLNLISRHSYQTKFDKQISIVDMKTRFDKNVYQNVYNDFENNLYDYLIIYDVNNLKMQNVYSFQRLITIANDEFTKKTGKGLELLILDGISNLRIDRGHRTITNKNNVETEYYSYLIDLARDFLGSGRMIPVVVTNTSKENFNNWLDEGADFNIEFITEPSRGYSSTIITVYGNDNLKRSRKLKLKVLKSLDKTMNESISIYSDYEHFYIRYENTFVDETVYKNGLIQYLKEENEELKKAMNKKESNIKLQEENASNDFVKDLTDEEYQMLFGDDTIFAC